ncbi:MAG: hypothetical protein VXW22_12010, partial [Pseudomonadota bacterium]|nr:hypothetical protein [Pseudomonadota bacterium]
LTTEHMKPVSDWVCENAPGLIGELYRDIIGRYDKDTPKSVALNTALTLCAIPAALRVTWITNGKKLTPSLYVLSLAYTGEGKDPARQYPAHFFAEASAKCMADPRLTIQQLPAFARFQAHFNNMIKGPGWEPDLPEVDPGDFGLKADMTLMPNAAGGSGEMPFDEGTDETLKGAIAMYEQAKVSREADIRDAREGLKLMPVLGLLRSSDVPTGSPALLEECYKARAKLFTWDEFGKHWGMAMSQPERDWDRSMIENFTRGPVASTAKVESKERNIRKYDAHDIAPSMHGFCVPDQLITQIQRHTETVSDGALNRRLIFMDPVKPEKSVDDRFSNWEDGANKRDEPPKELIADYLSLFVGFNDATQLPMPGKLFEYDPDGEIVRDETGAAKTIYKHAMEELIWVGHRVPKDYMVTMDLGEGGYSMMRQSQVGKLIIEIETRYDKMRRAFIAKGDNFGANCVVRAAEYTWRVACVAAYASRRTEVLYKDVHWADQYVSISVGNLLGMTGTMIVSERTKDEDRLIELMKEAYEMHLGVVKAKKSAIKVHMGQGEAIGALSRRDLFNRFRSGRDNASSRFKVALSNLITADRVEEVEVRTSDHAGRPKKCIRAEHLWDVAYAEMMNDVG